MKIVLAFLAVAYFLEPSTCFTIQIQPPCRHHHRAETRIHVASSHFLNEDQPSVWLEEFKTGTGEVVNPYRVLKVPRDAERTEIRASYLKLSRKFHPDGARHRDVLPGSCNNLDDVRDQWERISLSYRILSDRRTRKRYDRHEVLADPGEAMRRAALNAIGSSVVGVGKGIFTAGRFAMKSVVNSSSTNKSQINK